MATSLYDLSVPTFLQTVRAVAGFLQRAAKHDPPPLKWSDLRYVFDIKEDCNGKEAIQA